MKALLIGVALFASVGSTAMAQNGLPTGGQLPVAGGAAGGWYPGYGYGYAAAPLYGYAAPSYGYAAPSSTTVVIVPSAPAYTAPPVVSGYYGAPVVSQPIYDYAPGYGYGYTPGYWNRGYWGRWYQ
jgi:hypothetical protein